MENGLFEKLKDLYCDTYDEIIQDLSSRMDKKSDVLEKKIDKIEESLSELIDVLKEIVK